MERAGSDLEPGWLARVAPECRLQGRSSVQSSGTLLGEEEREEGTEIEGERERDARDIEHPMLHQLRAILVCIL